MGVGLGVVLVVKKDKIYCTVQCWRVILCPGLIVGSLTVLLDCLCAR